jgi:5-deoxy-glucuronate isomerase
MDWVFRKGSLKSGDWDVLLDPTQGKINGWNFTGMRTAKLDSSKKLNIDADSSERLIWPLDGEGLVVDYESKDESGSFNLRGRKSVFHGTADLVYLPINTNITISGNGRVVVAEAPAKNHKPVKFIEKDSFPNSIRGAGPESRQIHDFGGVQILDADRFIVVEVIVPAGNWSGVPPHKHDTYISGVESNLEEIYYFEIAPERNATPPTHSDPKGVFRGYSADDRPYDITTEVRSGDVVLVPYGWHGPIGAAPAYDMYFMNVMAGPDPERLWNVTDEPGHEWIRETWKNKSPDPRLPYNE